MFTDGERIREISTTTGAGTYTLGGAPTGYQPVSTIGANNYGPFFVTDGTNWEAIIGQYLTGPDRLARTTIKGSSSGGAAVNWAAGTRTIRSGWPAWLALPRRLAKSVAGGVGTTVLTLDEQLSDQLEFTGALTGNRVIEFDGSFPWAWDVFNNTTGAFTLTFRATGQTGFVIPQGKRARVFGDATDARAQTHFPNGLVVSNAGTDVLFVTSTGIGVGGTPSFDIHAAKSASGANVQLMVDNNSNTASSDGRIGARVAGSSGGNAVGQYTVSGVVDWFCGLDNHGTNGDTFKISKNGIQTNDYLSIDQSGAVIFNGDTAATGYTTAGDLTLPAARNVRAKNTSKAWVDFVGTSGAVNESFNVASVTRNGAGDYTVNFTNALGSATYALAGAANGGGGGVTASSVHFNTAATKSTTACTIYTKQATVLTDFGEVGVIFLGV